VQQNLDAAVKAANDALTDAQNANKAKLKTAKSERAAYRTYAANARSKNMTATANKFTKMETDAETDRRNAENARTVMQNAAKALKEQVVANQLFLLDELKKEETRATQKFTEATNARAELLRVINANKTEIGRISGQAKIDLDNARAEADRRWKEAKTARDLIRADMKTKLKEGLDKALDSANLRFQQAEDARTQLRADMEKARDDLDEKRRKRLEGVMVIMNDQFKAAAEARKTITLAHNNLTGELSAYNEELAKETIKINNEIAKLQGDIADHKTNYETIPQLQKDLTKLYNDLASLPATITAKMAATAKTGVFKKAAAVMKEGETRRLMEEDAYLRAAIEKLSK